MPNHYDNMNRPDPERRPRNATSDIRRSGQGSSSYPGRANVPPSSDPNRTAQPQSARPVVRKSQSLEEAKKQAYITQKYALQSNTYRKIPPQYQQRSSYEQGQDPRSAYGQNTSKIPASNRKPSPRQKRRRIISLGVMAVVILSLLLFWGSRYYQPVIVPGVYINNIDMSGRTKAEAISLLEQQMEEMRDSIRITLKHNDQTWILTRDAFIVEAPLELSVNRAMEVARKGSVFQRMKDGWEARHNQPHFEASVSISDQSMSDFVAAIAAELNVPAVNATMTFNADSADFNIEEGIGGYEMDQDRIKEAILQGLNNGYTVNTIEFGLEATEPAVKKADLDKATSRLSFFETKVTGSQNRIDNVRLALSQFNGMVVAPGQTVSFNDTTGKRSEENGYKEAPGINADKGLEDTLGGGVCQASTTLYNAVLQANCKIEERHRHSFPSSYVKEGFDAMVNWVTDDDFRFTNTSDMPIFIRTYVGKHDDGATYAQVWVYGKKLAEGITLSRKSVIIKEIEKPEPELIKDREGKYADHVIYDDEAYIAVASRKGLTVEAYLVTKDSRGNVIKEELLHTDNYSAITGKHYYGTQKRPDDVEVKAGPGCYLLPNAQPQTSDPNESPD